MKNNTINQSGRSMIEMLGVLAIVGVLSVGGIAGYSKAMQKYRTNKTIEQVTQIINGVRTLYSQQKDYNSLSSSGSEILKKAKILPESAFEGNTPKNPFGGNYWLDERKRNASDNSSTAVALWLYAIPDDACIELATEDWGAGEGLYAININSGINVLETYKGCSGIANDGAAAGCAGGSNVSLPIPMDAAVSACASNNRNDIVFYFY